MVRMCSVRHDVSRRPACRESVHSRELGPHHHDPTGDVPEICQSACHDRPRAAPLLPPPSRKCAGATGWSVRQRMGEWTGGAGFTRQGVTGSTGRLHWHGSRHGWVLSLGVTTTYLPCRHDRSQPGQRPLSFRRASRTRATRRGRTPTPFLDRCHGEPPQGDSAGITGHAQPEARSP
jgi:hypothetical protein